MKYLMTILLVSATTCFATKQTLSTTGPLRSLRRQQGSRQLLAGSDPCKFGCDRTVNPGTTKNGNPFDTCCRYCTKSKGKHVIWGEQAHSEECNIRNAPTVPHYCSGLNSPDLAKPTANPTTCTGPRRSLRSRASKNYFESAATTGSTADRLAARKSSFPKPLSKTGTLRSMLHSAWLHSQNFYHINAGSSEVPEVTGWYINVNSGLSGTRWYAKADEWTGLRIPHDVGGFLWCAGRPKLFHPANGGWVIRVTTALEGTRHANKSVQLVKMNTNYPEPSESYRNLNFRLGLRAAEIKLKPENIDPTAKIYDIYYDTKISDNGLIERRKRTRY